MKKLLAFVASSLLLSVGAHAAPYKSPDGVFAVAFPAAPILQKDSIFGANGATQPRVSYMVQTNDCLLMIRVVDLHNGSATSGDEAASFDTMWKNLKSEAPDKVIDKVGGESDISNGGYKGKEIKGTTNSSRVDARLYRGAHRLVVAQALCQKGNKASAQVSESFFQSLQLFGQ
jgi:hypothetical protein